MKCRRVLVSIFPLCVLYLLITACAQQSNTVVPDRVEDAVPPTQADANALPDTEEETEGEAAMDKITLTFNGQSYTATLADNPSAEAFAALLKEGPLAVSTHDYGNFEKVGSLGTELPRTDEQITTVPGDIILYQGNQITVYYAQNTWSFTRLGKIDDPTGLREALGSGDVEITFALASSAALP